MAVSVNKSCFRVIH